jgi:hypothetical protein
LFCSVVAHIHHAWEIFNRYGRTVTAAKRAAIICRTLHFLPLVVSFGGGTCLELTYNSPVFQFAYTTLFGSYCSYLFIRTGSIFPALVAHSFCNVMGLPQIANEVKRWPQRKYGIYLVTLLTVLLAFTDVFCIYSNNFHIYSWHFALYLYPWSMDILTGEPVLATAHFGGHHRWLGTEAPFLLEQCKLPALLRIADGSWHGNIVVGQASKICISMGIRCRSDVSFQLVFTERWHCYHLRGNVPLYHCGITRFLCNILNCHYLSSKRVSVTLIEPKIWVAKMSTSLRWPGCILINHVARSRGPTAHTWNCLL